MIVRVGKAPNSPHFGEVGIGFAFITQGRLDNAKAGLVDFGEGNVQAGAGPFDEGVQFVRAFGQEGVRLHSGATDSAVFIIKPGGEFHR